MPNETKTLLDVYLNEFDKLKAEQIHRIGFRDNMIYVTLVSVGGVMSFATSETSHLVALLIIPWICCVLGWMYLVNDEKISALGRYIRRQLEHKIREQINMPEVVIFEWEVAHRSDKRRVQRKIMQLLVDQITFCASGIISICAFWVMSPVKTTASITVSFIELVVLLILCYQIFIYADIRGDT